jgi:dipeptidyl-peptidase 4
MDSLLSAHRQTEDNYICRVDSTPNNNFLVQIQNRLQTTLHLLYIESSPPYRWHSVLKEEATPDTWINLHDLLTLLPQPQQQEEQEQQEKSDVFQFIWGSERSGYRQLYLYEYNHTTHSTTLLNPIGEHGEWVVDSIIATDAKRSLVFYSGNTAEHPSEKHVYVSSLLASSPASSSACGSSAVAVAADSDFVKTVRLTQEAGWYQEVVINLEDNVMFGIHSSLSSPPVLFRTQLPHAPLTLQPQPQKQSQTQFLFANLTSASSSASVPFQTHDCSASGLKTSLHFLLRARSLLSLLRLPELHTVEYQSSGQLVQLQCSLLLPDPARYGQGPYPCVVPVYGGPHVQRVANTWVRSPPPPPLAFPSVSSPPTSVSLLVSPLICALCRLAQLT